MVAIQMLQGILKINTVHSPMEEHHTLIPLHRVLLSITILLSYVSGHEPHGCPVMFFLCVCLFFCFFYHIKDGVSLSPLSFHPVEIRVSVSSAISMCCSCACVVKLNLIVKFGQKIVLRIDQKISYKTVQN